MTSNPLLIDPTEQARHFDSAATLSAFEAGAKEDQEEAEAILAELDALSKEFQLWAYARITRTTENERGELTRESEQLKEIEQAQDLGRTKLASFMDTFKGAFKALLG